MMTAVALNAAVQQKYDPGAADRGVADDDLMAAVALAIEVSAGKLS
jgi:hypothetical protein